MSKERIRWADDEREAVVNAAYDLQCRRPQEPITAIIKKAQQKALPKSRHRNIVSVLNVPWLITGLKQKHKECQDRMADLRRQLEGARSRIEQAEHAARQKVNAEECQKAIDEHLGGMTVEDLLALAMTKLGEERRRSATLLSGMADDIRRLCSASGFKSSTGPSGVMDAPAHTVAVIGLKNNQQRALEENMQHVKFNFISSNQSRKTLPQTDLIVVMTKFCGHDWINAVNCQKDARRVIMYYGGVKKLAETIRKELEDNEVVVAQWPWASR